METQFKVLMYAGRYVDTKNLINGIYTTQTPTLYSKDDTFDLMIGVADEFNKKLGGEKFFGNDFKENLLKCELVDVTLTIKQS